MMATELEEETDESLIALTTHFAQVSSSVYSFLSFSVLQVLFTHYLLMCFMVKQVQFRLKQIISAEPQHKEVC